MTRALLALAALSLVLARAPVAHAQSGPPTGFVVPPASDDDTATDDGDSMAPDDSSTATTKKKTTKPRDDSDADDDSELDGDGAPTAPSTPPPAPTPMPDIDRPAASLSIVNVPVGPRTEIDSSDLAGEKSGIPLVGGNDGVGLVRHVEPTGKGSFTFKASAADANEPPPRPSAPSQSTGLVLPATTDEAPLTTHDDDLLSPPKSAPPALHDETLGDDDVASPAPDATAPTSNLDDAHVETHGFLPAGKPVGPQGDGVHVEEVPLQYHPDTFVDVGGKKKKVTPPPEPTPEPAPATATDSTPAPQPAPATATDSTPAPQPAPATATDSTPAPQPAPVDSTPPADTAAPKDAPALNDEVPSAPTPTSTPARAPVVSSSPAAPSDSAAPDPFQKLDTELRALDNKPLPAGPSDDDETKPKPPPEPPKPREFETSPLAEKPLEVAPTVVPTRDPSLLGISLLAGAGVAVMDAPTGGFVPRLAYGVTAVLNPTFAGPFALDLSLMRVTHSGGTPAVSVDSAWHDIGVRLMFLKDQANNLFVGFGAGLLMTAISATYHVTDGETLDATGSQLRFGGDASAIIGLRLRPLEIRLDARVLLRGGLRLDFLPTLSAGVAF